MPRVDVIIPTFNREALLRKAIASVLNQSYQDFTIIIVDDGGNGEAKRVVDSFTDVRLEFRRNETNMGEAGARNTGLLNSTANYIAFLDDDDEWLPEKLKLEMDLLERQPAKVGGVYTGYTAIDSSSGAILSHRIPYQRGDLYSEMVRENVVGTPSTVLIRRECFERAGLFDGNIPYGLDYDMWIRISKEFHFDCIEKPLVRYHYHAGQLTNDLKRCIAGQLALMKKHAQFFASHRISYSKRYASLAYLYQQVGELDKSWEALLMAVRTYPYRKKYYYRLFKVCAERLMGEKRFHNLKEIKESIVRAASYGPKNE